MALASFFNFYFIDLSLFWDYNEKDKKEICQKRRDYMKKVLSVLVLIAVSISLSSCSVKKIKTTELNEYDEYLSKVEYAEDYMPSLEQCGNYSSFFATQGPTNTVFALGYLFLIS